VKTVPNPEIEKCKRFVQEQEDAQKDVERHLVCFNHSGLLFGTLLEPRAWRVCGRWRQHVSSCTAWSFRKSEMIASMIKTPNLRMSWLSHILRQHIGNISCICIIHWVIGTLMTAFKPIWLSIRGFMWKINTASLIWFEFSYLCNYVVVNYLHLWTTFILFIALVL
jgi:hypothetical protein